MNLHNITFQLQLENNVFKTRNTNYFKNWLILEFPTAKKLNVPFMGFTCNFKEFNVKGTYKNVF